MDSGIATSALSRLFIYLGYTWYTHAHNVPHTEHMRISTLLTYCTAEACRSAAGVQVVFCLCCPVISLLNSQSSSVPLNSFPSQSLFSVPRVLHRTTTAAADAEHHVLGSL